MGSLLPKHRRIEIIEPDISTASRNKFTLRTSFYTLLKVVGLV
tara:strand:- start:399 stop:527 length:129 start_codon:yes stop_codon:yes gene_type:complete